MKHELIRRQQLGLSISGPFSSNRRRHENTYMFLAIGILLSAVSFIASFFV